jgi:hypothetical protein
VVAQVRALVFQPEIIVGTWMAARVDVPELTENETRDALSRLDPLWNELFPAEQARIVRLLVERVEIGPAGADIRLRVEGLASLVRDLASALRCAAKQHERRDKYHRSDATDDPAAAGAEDRRIAQWWVR